jgi:hypothetical protein
LGKSSAEKIIENNKITGLTITLPQDNIGDTSTVNVKNMVNWKAFPGNAGMPNDFDFADQTTVQMRQVDIPSKAAGNSTFTIPVEYFDATKKQAIRLYFWGWTSYNDVFKGTPRHLMEFCDEVTGVKITNEDVTNPATDFTWSLSLCTVPHNCYDQQCVDYEEKIHK